MPNYTLKSGVDRLHPFLKTEVRFSRDIKRRSTRSDAIKRIQEWLSFHGYSAAIDGQFGPITERKVRQFQADHGLSASGVVDEMTHNELVAPLMNALRAPQLPPRSFNDAILFHARVLLASALKEVGGQNRGPIVRATMDGQEGVHLPWCAGFSRLILRQAAESMGIGMPIQGSQLCDTFGNQATTKSILLNGDDDNDMAKLTPGSFFLRRASNNPNKTYDHMGVVKSFSENSFETVEGNTGFSGTSEGNQIETLERAFGNFDFIAFESVTATVSPHIIEVIPDSEVLSIAGQNHVVRRYFYEGLVPHPTFPEDASLKQQGYTYGSFFEHWGGWITAGHVIRDINFSQPDFAGGELINSPGGTDSALLGCTRLPSSQPRDLVEEEPVIVLGYPAGSLRPSKRQGVAAMYRPGASIADTDYGRWVIRIDHPHEPVVPGMSGGIAVSANTGEVLGIIVTSNSPGNADNFGSLHFEHADADPEDDHSLDIVSLHDVWDALRQDGRV